MLIVFKGLEEIVIFVKLSVLGARLSRHVKVSVIDFFSPEGYWLLLRVVLSLREQLT